jgi:hypothetical protein
LPALLRSLDPSSPTQETKPALVFDVRFSGLLIPTFSSPSP